MRVFSEINKYQRKKCGAPLLGLAKSTYYPFNCIISFCLVLVIDFICLYVHYLVNCLLILCITFYVFIYITLITLHVCWQIGVMKQIWLQ